MAFLGESTYTLRRYDGEATLVNGVVSPGSYTDTTVDGSLQSLGGRSVERLAEGDRARGDYLFLTLTRLYPDDEDLGQTGDLIIDAGDSNRTFKVTQVLEPTDGMIGQYECILVEVRPT